MIQIKLKDGIWRIQIGSQDGEVWEFKTREELFKTLDNLMTLKEIYGKLEEKK